MAILSKLAVGSVATLFINKVASKQGFLGCPKSPKPQAEFDFDRYKGTWYEIQRDTEHFLEKGMQCKYSDIQDVDYRENRQNTLEAVILPDSKTDVYGYCEEKYEGVFTSDTWLQVNSVEGEAGPEEQIGAYQEMFGLEFQKTMGGKGRTTYKNRYIEYNVLYTDYEEYSIVYGCDEWLGGWYHTMNAFIYSRKPYMTPSLYNEALEKLKLAVPSTYDPAIDMEFSGKDCGWNLCSDVTLTNYEENPEDRKLVDKILYKVNDEPETQIALDDFLKTSQCFATFSVWNVLDETNWIDIPQSPLKHFLKYDKNDHIIKFNQLNSNDLLGDFTVAIQIQTDANVKKYKTFDINIVPNCEIETLYDLSFKSPALAIPENMYHRLFDAEVSFIDLTRQYVSSCECCPLDYQLELKNDELNMWEPISVSILQDIVIFEEGIVTFKLTKDRSLISTYKLRVRTFNPSVDMSFYDELSFHLQAPDCSAQRVEYLGHSQVIQESIKYTPGDELVIDITQYFQWSNLIEECPVSYELAEEFRDVKYKLEQSHITQIVKSFDPNTGLLTIEDVDNNFDLGRVFKIRVYAYSLNLDVYEETYFFIDVVPKESNGNFCSYANAPEIYDYIRWPISDDGYGCVGEAQHESWYNNAYSFSIQDFFNRGSVIDAIEIGYKNGGLGFLSTQFQQNEFWDDYQRVYKGDYAIPKTELLFSNGLVGIYEVKIGFYENSLGVKSIQDIIVSGYDGDNNTVLKQSDDSSATGTPAYQVWKAKKGETLAGWTGVLFGKRIVQLAPLFQFKQDLYDNFVELVI